MASPSTGCAMRAAAHSALRAEPSLRPGAAGPRPAAAGTAWRAASPRAQRGRDAGARLTARDARRRPRRRAWMPAPTTTSSSPSTSTSSPRASARCCAAAARAQPRARALRRERSTRPRTKSPATARRWRSRRASSRCCEALLDAPGRHPVARPARGAPLRLGRGSREQRGGGLHPRAAQEARRGLHPERARRRLPRAPAPHELAARAPAGVAAWAACSRSGRSAASALSQRAATRRMPSSTTSCARPPWSLRDQPVEYQLVPRIPAAGRRLRFRGAGVALDGGARLPVAPARGAAAA